MVSDRPRNGRYKKSDIQTPADPVSNSFMGSLRESQSKNNNGTNSRLKEAAGSRAGMTDIEQDLLGSTPIELSKGSTKSASTASGGAATAGSATTVTQYAPYQESLKKPLIGGGSSSIIMKPSSSKN